jgi:FlaA1/EpsC-like NDP-sugar epimerase
MIDKKKIEFYSPARQIAAEGCTFVLALLASYLIRFEEWPQGPDLWQLLFWLPVIPGCRIVANWLRGSYKHVWRFVSFSDMLQITSSLVIVTAGLLAVRFVTPLHGSVAALFRLPFSIIALEFLLSLTGALGIRAMRRLLYTHERQSSKAANHPPKRVLLYGAGRAGQLLVRELEASCEVDVVGFIDDDPGKLGAVIVNTQVLGDGEHLIQIVENYQIDELIISMATATQKTMTRIVATCRRANVPSKIIPSIPDILSGSVPISHLRDTQVEDVLGRESIEVSQFEALARPSYQGKKILVTGGGGSIGSELVRQLTRLQPARIAILDKDENCVYELEQELIRKGAGGYVEAKIADVRERSRLEAVFSEFQPQFVFHAAAHKHVPLMEKEPCEAILNNVVGTKNVLDMAAAYSAEGFVFISTDKAVNPVNVMGATKRIGELLVQSAAGRNGMLASCVRFGNVLASRGSVIPLFQRQIAEGGPVTITHPDMVRYFMTIQEAVQLILCAGTLAGDGNIFVLEMGTPRKIMDLAREMIVLSGLEPEKDIHTKITGLRPGEKLYEELSRPSETLIHTGIEKLNTIHPVPFDKESFLADLEMLIASAENNNSRQIYELLCQMDLNFGTPSLQARAATAHS